jgi:hypothetical protein
MNDASETEPRSLEWSWQLVNTSKSPLRSADAASPSSSTVSLRDQAEDVCDLHYSFVQLGRAVSDQGQCDFAESSMRFNRNLISSSRVLHLVLK